MDSAPNPTALTPTSTRRLSSFSRNRKSKDNSSNDSGSFVDSPRTGKLQALLSPRRAQNEQDAETGESKLKTLLRGGSRRRKKSQIRTGSAEDFDLPTPEPKTNLDDNSGLSTPADDLVTSDSEIDGPATRPVLLTRKSHAGYLTSSAPEIRVQTVDLGKEASDPPTSPSPQLSPMSKVVTTNESSSTNINLNTTQSGTRSRSGTLSTAAPVENQEKASNWQSVARKAAPAPITTTTNGTGVSNSIRPLTPKSQQPFPAATTFLNPKRNSAIISTTTDTVSPHRRAQSEIPGGSSALQSTSALLASVEDKVQGQKTQPVGQFAGGGFFSSVLNAAQSAATSLSKTIENVQGLPKNPLPTNIIGPNVRARAGTGASSEQTTKTAATMGNGDLQFSHLGIATPEDPASESEHAGRNRSDTVIHREEARANTEDFLASQAITAAYKDESVPEKKPVAEDNGHSLPPPAVAPNYAPSSTGGRTPPGGSVYEGNEGMYRSGSLRSKLSTRRRGRNNSVSAIGAAINATSNSALLGVPGPTSLPKTTGFATASKKRNRDFHQLFRSVPEDDYLIEDYSCALQKDIILAGRVYISEGHICFSSNILGWVTTLIISIDEVVSVEKEYTAVVFPNAIAIQTVTARHTFRSLLSREATYDLIIGIWRISHPGLQSWEFGTKLVTPGGAEAAIDTREHSDDENSDFSGDEQDVYDEDDEHDDASHAGDVFVDAGKISPDEPASPTAGAEKKSSPPLEAGGRRASSPARDIKPPEKSQTSTSTGSEFPGPAVHGPTECNDQTAHYEKSLIDDTVPGPLGKVYSMLFGAGSLTFMSRYLTDEAKCWDINWNGDKKGLDESKKSREYTYMKPLPGSVGPSKTKCVVTETLEHFDVEKSMTVVVSTQTPDVPSGGVFCTKTRYCLMWGPANSTRLIMNFTLEWTGKSWIKGLIEKGALDGQTTYAQDLVRTLRTTLSTRGRTGTMVSGPKGKTRKRAKTGDAMSRSNTDGSDSTEAKTASWGFFEPLRKPLGPVATIVGSIVATRTMVAVVLFLMLWSQFRGRHTSTMSDGRSGRGSLAGQGLDRFASYEMLWKNEEASLWDWMEERIGIHEGFALGERGLHRDQTAQMKQGDKKQKVLSHSSPSLFGGQDASPHANGLSEREIEWAIGITEQKLDRLKVMMNGGTAHHPQKAAKNEVDEKGGKRE